MPIIWQTTSVTEPTAATLHRSEYAIADYDALKQGVLEIVEKATSLFPGSLKDDSQYLLFEWDEKVAVLTVVVTDIEKTNDSQEKVQCQLSGAMLAEADFADDFSYAIRDYLTTCASFMAYSIVAVFCDKSRTHSQLL